MRTLYRYGTEIVTVFAIAVFWITGALVFRYTIPQYAFGWAYHLIPGLFLAMSFVVMVLSAGWEYEVEEGRMPRDKVLVKYMIWKAVKIGICIIFVLAYWLISGVQFNAFLLTFMVFYIISLAMESLLFVRIQNRIDAAIKSRAGAEKE